MRTFKLFSKGLAPLIILASAPLASAQQSGPGNGIGVAVEEGRFVQGIGAGISGWQKGDVDNLKADPNQVQETDPRWTGLSFEISTPFDVPYHPVVKGPIAGFGVDQTHAVANAVIFQGGVEVADPRKVNPNLPFCILDPRATYRKWLGANPPAQTSVSPLQSNMSSPSIEASTEYVSRMKIIPSASSGITDSGDIHFWFPLGQTKFNDVECHAAKGHAIFPQDVQRALGSAVSVLGIPSDQPVTVVQAKPSWTQRISDRVDKFFHDASTAEGGSVQNGPAVKPAW